MLLPVRDVRADRMKTELPGTNSRSFIKQLRMLYTS